ncbi:MAG: hypothetical protein M1836_002224 [Candelina mexicana]|nr:MAG: hypothetical protein M1836_002224 [Candelina mexicana]
MVRGFHVGDENNAAFYAGLLISAFALSESLTGMFWGCLSDRIGRKPVLLFGCAGTMFSLLLVGFATNIWVALAGRALGGFLNGNIGVLQTIIAELVTNPEHERELRIIDTSQHMLTIAARAYAVMPFVWSIGTIIGPIIGGLFSNPSVSFPSFFSSTGFFAKFPYLLPNLVCAAMLLISIIAGYLFLYETHPDLQPWSTPSDFEHTSANTPLMATAGATEHAGVDLRSESYGTFNAVDMAEDERWVVKSNGAAPSLTGKPPRRPKTFTRRIVLLVIALGIFTYHSMAYDHLLPIFLQDSRVENISALVRSPLNVPGGLGLTTKMVGLIMSVNGMIALVIQAVIFPLFAEWLGIWRVFLLVTILHPVAYFIVPYLTMLPPGHWLYAGIYGCLTIRNFLSILAYPVILIMLKEATPSPLVLGKINGLAASVGAACRCIAPPVAGWLYGLGTQIGFTGLAWWGSGLVAIIGAMQCFSIEREKKKTTHVRSIATCVAREPEPKPEVIHIMVEDVDGV